MNLNFLPLNILNAINKLNLQYLTEIRLRRGCPVILNYNNYHCYLGLNDIIEDKNNSIFCLDEDIACVLKNVTEHSLYAFNDRLKEGYITTNDGIRIGVSGECVCSEKTVLTLKNIASLNIRIPHKIKDCSNSIFNYILYNGEIKNTLIISPPAFGKTTILKDLAEKFSRENIGAILIVDERAEFCDVVGENIDKIVYSDKLYGFTNGIRSMSPKIIITDELVSISDWDCVKNAVNSGVKVIASCHGANIYEIINKNEFVENMFEVYVVLNGDGEPGQVNKIYNKEFNVL